MKNLKENLENLHRLEGKRTGGNWHGGCVHLYGNWVSGVIYQQGNARGDVIIADTTNYTVSDDDLHFIAAAPLMMQVITELERRLEVAKGALVNINGFAQHDENCRINDWQGVPECTCGYTDAWGQTQEALATLNGE